jgi:hypothetical protein
MTRFPKRTGSAATGETGVNLVSLAVNDDLRWIFRRTHNEHDFGIDGYIDIVEEGGSVTGRTISVQIKCGSSFLEESDYYGITFRGKQSHLNYLLNHPTPTIIVICDPKTRACYWELLTPERTQGTGDGWKITIPRHQLLDASHKGQLHEIAGAATDVVSELESYWAINKIVAEAGALIYTIDRADIESLNIEEASKFFERLSATRDFAVQNQDKVILHVWGYDDDERELWEISEVRRWFKAAEPIIKFWFYFLKNSDHQTSLKLLVSCVCRVIRHKQKGNRINLEFNKDDLVAFIQRNFEWLNEITDRLGLPIEDNKRLSFSAMDVLGIPHE